MEIAQGITRLQKWKESPTFQNLKFIIRHLGKTKFMLMMSKKLQILGMEKLYLQNPRDFISFFFLFLFRDTILYIIIPILVVSFIDT